MPNKPETARIEVVYTSVRYAQNLVGQHRWFDPADGSLYMTQYSSAPVAHGFRGSAFDACMLPSMLHSAFASVRVLSKPATVPPVKRYAVQLGDGTGNGAGNSLRHYNDRVAAVQNAKEKATAYPGKAVKLLELTEVETFRVSTITTKSWE